MRRSARRQGFFSFELLHQPHATKEGSRDSSESGRDEGSFAGVGIASMKEMGTSQIRRLMELDRVMSKSGSTDSDASPDRSRLNAPAPTPAGPAPCPFAVRLGQVAPFAHENLDPAQKLKWRTYLGTTTRMDLSPPGNYAGRCVVERVKMFKNSCPASVTKETSPCDVDNLCLPVGKGARGDAPTHTTLPDDTASFIDLHRTRNQRSVLEGTGLNACSYTCRQEYFCENAAPRDRKPLGVFFITRAFKADQFTPPGGQPLHITTGTVTKEEKGGSVLHDLVAPPVRDKGDFPTSPAGKRVV